jgi:hypothetical protein
MSSLRKFKRGTGSPLIKEVARRQGVPEDEVRTEIEEAIKYGMNSKEPEAMAFWAQFNGRTPTVEEVVKVMVNEIQKDCK